MSWGLVLFSGIAGVRWWGGTGRPEGGGGTWVLSTWREARSVILYSLSMCGLTVKCVPLPCVRPTGGDHGHAIVDALCLNCPCDPPCLFRFHCVRFSVFGSCPAFRVSLGMACGGPCGRRRWGQEGVKRQILFYIGSRYQNYAGRRAVFFFPLRQLSP